MSTAPPTGAERARSMLLAAEVSLCALTCAAAFGLIRLFDDGSFVPQVVAAAVLAHLLAAVCRRRGLGPGTTVAIGVAVMVVVLPWLLLRETTIAGLPTADTLHVARTQISDAWHLFGDVRAPAPTSPGFVLAAAIGVWGLAFLSDAAAFRAGGLIEAMVPASTLFVFGAALGAPRSRSLCTALFLAALLAFWLCARAYKQLSAPQWMAREDGDGAQAILRIGALIGAIAVLAALVIGPNLPGAHAESVIPWRASDRDKGSSRVTVSPLVDIRTRIVDQAGVEAFTVHSPVRSYWRLTALETFDGRIWSSSRRYQRAVGKLGTTVDTEDDRAVKVDQSFDIVNLDSIWLPAAFRPVSIDGTDARFDAESSSLLTESENAVGARYDVVSSVPRLDAAELATATSQVPRDIAATYLALPPDFPGQVRALAARVIGDAGTPYAAAKRLQDFFRGGEFTYDLDVPPGHGDDALQQFLFRTRRGYCEQFAGAYAAMARAVGLPARVGVGFTTGDAGPDDTYTVRGYHGHAWPEVYLAGFGWVPFEPTPGRGIPGGEGYTGVPEAQASPTDPSTATTLATTTTVTTPADSSSTTVTLPDVGDASSGSRTAARTESRWIRILAVIAFLLLLPLVWLGGVTAVRLSRRRRRRARASTASARIDVAWTEVGEALARAGVPARRSETPTEYARRASRVADLDPRLLDGLAGLTTAARYAPPDDVPDDETIEQAVAVAREIEETLEQRLDRRTRIRDAFDPRVPAGR